MRQKSFSIVFTEELRGLIVQVKIKINPDVLMDWIWSPPLRLPYQNRYSRSLYEKPYNYKEKFSAKYAKGVAKPKEASL